MIYQKDIFELNFNHQLLRRKSSCKTHCSVTFIVSSVSLKTFANLAYLNLVYPSTSNYKEPYLGSFASLAPGTWRH